MKTAIFAFFAAGLMSLGADEVKAPVTGAMIFKNNISAVRRTIDPGKMTRFELAETIVPLQGSLWFTGPVQSVVRKEGKKPVKGKYPLSNIVKTFAGQSVTLTVTNGKNAYREITGTVWDPVPDPEKNNAGQEPDMVWLKLSDGQFVMIARHLITGIRVNGQPKPAALPEKFDKRPVWEFTLSAPAKEPFFVDYLTNGLSWQSAYRMELGKNHKMNIAMDAEIVNNLADLCDADLFLASGYVNFANSGVTSPMAMTQSAAGVEPPVARQYSTLRKARFNNADMAVAAASVPESAAFGADATGETEDIALLPLRKFTLKKGEVCHRVLERAETSFERLVHWQIPARRNPDNGRSFRSDHAEPMDALRFKNPFDNPMTASPVEILDGGVVLAQVNIPWINRGETAVVDITRAQTVSGKVVEYDVPPQNTDRAEQILENIVRNKKGQVVSGTLAGINYRITDVQGELRMKNHRKSPARILIKLHYSGTLVSADGSPENAVQDRNLSINPPSCLTWEMELPGNAEKILKYRYNVIFR